MLLQLIPFGKRGNLKEHSNKNISILCQFGEFKIALCKHKDNNIPLIIAAFFNKRCRSFKIASIVYFVKSLTWMITAVTIINKCSYFIYQHKDHSISSYFVCACRVLYRMRLQFDPNAEMSLNRTSFWIDLKVFFAITEWFASCGFLLEFL